VGLESIRREIHALTRIDHPGVVRILDYGVHEGKPWYAMVLLEGETLRSYMQRTWSRYRRDSIPSGATEHLVETETVPTALAQASGVEGRCSMARHPSEGHSEHAGRTAVVRALGVFRF
jgi:hypothetical protein